MSPGSARGSIAALCAAAALTFSAAPARAQGGPPLLTDDPGTPGDGNWEINVGFTAERFPARTRFEAPLLDVNYGWGERIQLKYEVPWLVLDAEDGGDASGLGESLLGLKYRFLDEDRHGVSMSTYPQVSLDAPSSSEEDGLTEPGTELLLPLEVGRRVGRTELSLELGYALIEHAEDEWICGLAAAWPAAERLDLVGELHGEATSDLGDGSLVFDLGAVVRLREGVGLMFSAGRSFREPSDTEPELRAYLGLQLLR